MKASKISTISNQPKTSTTSTAYSQEENSILYETTAPALIRYVEP